MANTFTQIYIHLVFAVKGRQSLINRDWKERLQKYITGIIKNEDQKLLAVNSMHDHIHMFIGLKPDIALSDLVRVIKSNSSKFINEQRLTNGKFHWQEGFGAFSYSHSQIDTICNYIKNQEEHHRRRTFREEYIEILKKFAVGYNEKYVFDWIGEIEKSYQD